MEEQAEVLKEATIAHTEVKPPVPNVAELEAKKAKRVNCSS